MSADWNVWASVGTCATAVIAFIALIYNMKLFKLQTKQYEGRVYLDLYYNGEHVAVRLSNDGACPVQDIEISADPHLVIKYNNTLYYDGCVGTYKSWIFERKIHELLPHHSIVDEYAYPIKDFEIHFSNFLSICVKLKYSIDGKITSGQQIIDIECLRENNRNRKKNNELLTKI